MSLKLAVGGKGGVGKTTITSLIARSIAALNKDTKVIAIDADPVANLAAGLGIDESIPITPISELSDLIAERTGATPGTMGGFFTLNPKVDDIPDRFSIEKDGVKLLVMGTVQKGGSGCICPESTILKALMNHLVLARNEVVVMDMEAGVEHLGRATSGSVDALIVVVNPGKRSRVAADKIKKLGMDIGIKNIVVLGNRIKSEEDKQLIIDSMTGYEILGFIPEMDEIVRSDRDGTRPFDDISQIPEELIEITKKLTKLDS
ncbi:MAG: AAA family ATPase [Desulfobacula sp.]|uniref:ATP-binding protein n=1 Tax=Desulfobacula sp. TaxID=2593537 RepID=UPI001D96D075|nr:AAA family ATPase [Desulfobacula sp.]MBT3486692.1 AAA family ATPase [Desulfobacula sp.]MBT3802969.1 AAA family ATPase [Desulfobacula sp.]MBT4023518.1 AAA family ATPase [Desulfobacula sp.]MBT4197017.1 AAA family ATPase [Desulfobacula sp.]